MNPGQPPPPPRPGYFFEPTDVAWDAQGNIFISDGYQNSTVHKFDKDGNIVKMVGTARGSGPGQFSTPHAIAVDARGNVYVADRSNTRIQVLDNDLNYVREINTTRRSRRATSRRFPISGSAGGRASLWPNTLCITPGPTQAHLHDTTCCPGRSRSSRSTGAGGPFASAGRNPGQFGWVRAISRASP